MRIVPYLLLCLGLLVSACEPVKVLNATVPKEGYRVTHDVAYGQNPAQKLDIYLPDAMSKDTPVVVFFHGGAWRSGNRSEYLFAAQGLASMGYMVIVPDYRLFPESKYPDFLDDSAKAVVWVYKNIRKYGGNSENLYLVGHSAGAYNVVMLGLNPSYLKRAGGNIAWLRGIVGISGPYDFLPMTDPEVIEVFSSEKNLPKTQPITYVNAKAPRMLLLTGSSDDSVEPKNSRNLYKALKALGNDVTLKEYDLSHKGIIVAISDTSFGEKELREDVRKFIDER